MLRGNGLTGPNIAWPTSPVTEALRAAWLDAPDLPARKSTAGKLQLQALQDVPYIPLGQVLQPTAYDATLTGMPKGAPVFWNVRRG
jgi:peptide/nickel transport system substrate-binding protein